MPSGLSDAFFELLDTAEGLLIKRELPRLSHAELSRIVYELRDLAGRMSLYSSKYRSFISREGDELSYRALCLDPSEILGERLSLGGSAVLFSATLTPTDYYRTVLGGRDTDEQLDLPSPFDPEHLCVAVLDKISTRYSDREASLLAVARAILTAVKAKPGNYLVFCPSFAYLKALSGAIARLAPRLPLICQRQQMSGADRAEFISRFSEGNKSALVGLAVLGGIFGEGIDLTGRRLIGSIVIGVGLPQPTPEREAICAYYEDTLESGREYAYHYPGMNRVLQAAGRVIRREDDRGIILFIDDRYGEPLYREMIPAHWRSLKYVGDLASLTHLLERFWNPKK
jgi:Rad3-related DNA helicase